MADERYAEFTEETPKAFVQGLYEESATKKHRLGTVRRLSDGREFIYCKMGATAGVAGRVYQGVAIDVANQSNLAVANANIGDRQANVTMGTTTLANTANYFAEGYLHVNTGASNGMAYKIKSHPAIASAAAGVFTLYDKIRNANFAAATTKVSLTENPCQGVIVHTSPETGVLVGVCTFPVTANYYAWLQKSGPCPVEIEVAANAGFDVYASNAADGTVTVPTQNANFIVASTTMSARVGRVINNNANDHWALVDLQL